MTDLEHAIDIARAAHAGQVDKAGAPYIEHPLRVMAAVEGEHAKMTAVLHDVVEDTDVDLDDLRAEGFPEPVLEAVDRLTRWDGDSYDEYLARVMEDPLALRVKIADMTDNMDLSRIPEPTEKDRARLDKYRRVLPQLQAALRGHQGGVPWVLGVSEQGRVFAMPLEAAERLQDMYDEAMDDPDDALERLPVPEAYMMRVDLPEGLLARANVARNMLRDEWVDIEPEDQWAVAYALRAAGCRVVCEDYHFVTPWG